jgi:hypothetical protein
VRNPIDRSVQSVTTATHPCSAATDSRTGSSTQSYLYAYVHTDTDLAEAEVVELALEGGVLGVPEVLVEHLVAQHHRVLHVDLACSCAGERCGSVGVCLG